MSIKVLNLLTSAIGELGNELYGYISHHNELYDIHVINTILIAKRAEEALDKWVDTMVAPTQSVGTFLDISDLARAIYIGLIGYTWKGGEVTVYDGKWHTGGFSAGMIKIPKIGGKSNYEETFVLDYFDELSSTPFDTYGEWSEQKNLNRQRPRTLIMFSDGGTAHWAVELKNTDTPINEMSLEEFTELLKDRNDRSDVITAIKDLRKVLKQRHYMKLLKKGDD